MSKIKLIDSTYDEESGISCATISTDLGEFTGYAFLNPEDKEIASSYAGCNYAERRAVMYYYEKKLKILKNKIQVLNEVTERLENSDDCSVASYEFRLLQKIAKEYYQREHDTQHNVNMIKIALEQDMKNRPLLVDQLRKKSLERKTK